MNETNFICYLIDNCEGQCICEESLHEWYAEYLKSEQYTSGRNSESPPLYEEGDCPECGGNGKGSSIGVYMDGSEGLKTKCRNCKGTGKIRKPIYYTPEVYEAWMHEHGQPEFKLGDDCAAWILTTLNEWELWEVNKIHIGPKVMVYVAIPGQPKPPVEESEK